MISAIDAAWTDPKSASVLDALLHEATVPSDPTDMKKLGAADQAVQTLAAAHKAIDSAGQLCQGFFEASNVDMLRAQMRFTMLTRWRQSLNPSIAEASR